jgi:hypothetical protein
LSGFWDGSRELAGIGVLHASDRGYHSFDVAAAGNVQQGMDRQKGNDGGDLARGRSWKSKSTFGDREHPVSLTGLLGGVPNR